MRKENRMDEIINDTLEEQQSNNKPSQDYYSLWYKKGVALSPSVSITINLERRYQLGDELVAARTANDLIDEMMESAMTKYTPPQKDPSPVEKKAKKKTTNKKVAKKKQNPTPPEEGAHSEDNPDDLQAIKSKILQEHALTPPPAKNLMAEIDSTQDPEQKTQLKLQLKTKYVEPFLRNALGLTLKEFNNLDYARLNTLYNMLTQN